MIFHKKILFKVFPEGTLSTIGTPQLAVEILLSWIVQHLLTLRLLVVPAIGRHLTGVVHAAVGGGSFSDSE
jgi:hypothetical protein